MIKAMILAAAALTMSATAADAQTMIEKNNIKVENHLMTPEALWAMGRIGAAEASPNGKQVVYQVVTTVLRKTRAIRCSSSWMPMARTRRL